MSCNCPTVNPAPAPVEPKVVPVVLFNDQGLCTLMDRDYSLGKNVYVPFEQLKPQMVSKYGAVFDGPAGTPLSGGGTT